MLFRSEAAAPVQEPEAQPTAPIYATAKKRGLPSVGEYILAFRAGGSDFAQFNENIRAATGDVVVSDAAGLVPTPVVTPVYDDVNALRPIVSALGARQMPAAGSTFLRPKIATHSGVAEQANELGSVNTADFDLSNVTFTKKTFAGTLLLSEQVIDWSTPSMLDAAVNDLAGQYALQTEKYVVDQMAAAVTNSQEVILTSYTDDEEFITDLYLALPRSRRPATTCRTRWSSLRRCGPSSARSSTARAVPCSRRFRRCPASVSSARASPAGPATRSACSSSCRTRSALRRSATRTPTSTTGS